MRLIQEILAGIAGLIGLLLMFAFQLFIYGGLILLAVWFFRKVISLF
jgi:preprotein translocase subunit SecD